MIADILSVYEDLLWLSAFLAIVVGVYMAPTILAFYRKVPNKWSVAVINFFLGWILIGWVVALALAVRDTKKAEVTA